MDPLLNPYTPNAGAKPPIVVGRDDQLANFDLLLARLVRGRTEQSMIITGLRGVGKTVLLGQFRSKALAANWVTVEIEASKHEEDAFRRDLFFKIRSALFELSPKARWDDRLRRAASVLKSFSFTFDPSGSVSASLDVEAADGSADSHVLSMDLTELVLAIGEAASTRDRGIVFLIDEIQFLQRPQLEALITAIHKTVQRTLPVTLVGAGLPQIAELAGDAKSYAERLFKFPQIGVLNSQDAQTAISRPASEENVEFTPEALALAEEITGGYPYFIQELGSAIWSVAETSPVTKQVVQEAEPAYVAKLDASFFRVRLDRATPLQSAYLRAMGGLGPQPQKASDVAAQMGRTSENLAPTRAELINMGLLYTPEHGYAAFTVPHFDKFILRAMPTLEVPEKRNSGRKAR
ncbi:ATP-binding protein [Glutamicibacter sp. MNS18]|uniref:ATP-binding protein n=1 Tax=Glutamicibacter sp. MNS18 TaxID=2989817 RepID=UPI0022364FC9|nr:ATP-binding protein [Glutamicibacter sp. MNS18]MCW4465432.1 ATP-binding protein [Glutamicibacter sp. MNS18]